MAGQTANRPYRHPAFEDSDEDLEPTDDRADVINQQPLPVRAMRPVGGNKNAMNVPVNEATGMRRWSHRLAGCREAPILFLRSLLCPCMVFSQNYDRIEHLQRQGVPHPSGGQPISTRCFGYAALVTCCCFCWLYQLEERDSVRRRYNIEGSTPEDCFTSAFCAPCALTQESRELQLEETTCPAAMDGGPKAEGIAGSRVEAGDLRAVAV